MDFELTSEQEMLLDSARRFLAERSPFAARRAELAAGGGHSRALWRGLAELGLLSINVPDAHGGLGAGPVETMLVCRALGENLSLEPYLASAVHATLLIAALGDDAQQRAWFGALAAGELIAVPAVDEVAPAGGTGVVATATADGWRLRGAVPVVYHAPVADLLLVAATEATDAAVAGLYAVPRTAAGLTLEACRTVDGQQAADVRLVDVAVDRAARLGRAANEALDAARDRTLAAHCADTLGALDCALAATIEYLRTRQQFGGPIARFQALQHRVADMASAVEGARSMVLLATGRCTLAEVAARRQALAAAKVVVGQAARFVGQQSVQLHGGMGVTDELAISHYFRRLVAADVRFGSGEAHLSAYAERFA